jgi:hypothetical protein
MFDGNIHGGRNGKKKHTLNSSHLASDAPSPATTTIRAKNTKTNFISLQLLKSVEEKIRIFQNSCILFALYNSNFIYKFI